MSPRWLAAVVLIGAVSLHASLAGADQVPPAASEVAAAIDRLGSFDFAIRTEAARAVRRTAPATAVAALARAVQSHKDEYVRFRAMVILAGFGEEAARPVMRAAMGDRNDRVRTVVYQWFEHHPDSTALPGLLAALPGERSEFVRPALTRAIAAHGGDPRARAALLPLISRGEDLFRGALIEALGDYRARYAVSEIVQVARLEGPLQDDAITALGKIGDDSARPVLATLQPTASREVQPTISAAFCLLSIECEGHEAYLKQAIQFSAADAEYQPLLRGAVHALGMLATSGRTWAVTALVDAGTPAVDPARAAIALGVGLVALRRPQLMLEALAPRADLTGAVELLRDAFDMLSEDFEEERFYVEIRKEFWAASPGSARQRAAEQLIVMLEF